MPLFFPVRKNLRRVDKLLRNMSVVAEIQSAIALIRKHAAGSGAAIEQFVQRHADVTVVGGGTGRASNFRRYGPGTILDVLAGTDYQFPAAGIDAGRYVTVLQAELRAIASRLVMPEFMLSSDASNANYSSTMVAEGPATRMFERMQHEMIEDDLAVMRHVVAAAAAAGRLPARALSGVQICAVPPPLAVRNRLQEAQADQILVRSGAISVQTMAMRNGLDSDHEQQLIADRGDLHEANFNPDEPRDERGRWTTGGPGDGTVPGFFSISDPVGGSSAPSGPSGTAAPSSPPSGGGTAASGHTTAGSPPANAPAPTTKPAPKYEPEKWNNDPAVKGSNNCYSYALDRPKLPNGNPRPEGKPQPGEAAGNPVDDDHYDTDLNAAAKRDAYGVKDLPADGKCPPGYHKIQGFYDPSGSDYHWYRQDADGTWLQKHGKGEATNKDADGKVITDPNKANNNYGPGLNYSKACPVLIAPN